MCWQASINFKLRLFIFFLFSVCNRNVAWIKEREWTGNCSIWLNPVQCFDTGVRYEIFPRLTLFMVKYKSRTNGSLKAILIKKTLTVLQSIRCLTLWISEKKMIFILSCYLHRSKKQSGPELNEVMFPYM